MAAAFRRSIATLGQKFTQISSKFVLPEKLRGGKIEKGVNYIKVIAQDYKSALQDGVIDAKARPYKAGIYTGVALFATASIATNPTELDFLAQTTAWSNEMALVSKPVRNRRSEEHLKQINRLLNQQRLERYDLLLCSLMVRNDYGPNCQIYAAQCAFYEPTYFEILTSRIVDFGFFGRWWNIDWSMRDYDVNDDEFPSA